MLDTIIYDVKNNIGYITINRPKALNALNQVVLGELSEVVDMAEKDPNVKVVIITGAGGKAFELRHHGVWRHLYQHRERRKPG